MQPDHRRRAAGTFGALDERPDDELLAALAKVQAVVTQADVAVHDYVSVLRGRGISWTRIGEALGVSKQAAWERFAGEDEASHPARGRRGRRRRRGRGSP